jgi:hypothetical protein
MLSRIHDKLGTPGLILGIVACVIALGGTAVAALPGLNAKQKKEVKKIAKLVAKPGPAGPQGQTGASGAAGSQGAQGTAGAAGNNGENGEAGEDGACSVSDPECFLPPGATVTGDWNISEKGAEYAFVAISFPLRVAGEPTFNFINEGGVALFGSPDNCPGTAQAPKADPGNLCVYTSFEQNLTAPIFETFATADLHSGKGWAFPVPAGEEVVGIGSWAVTAGIPAS